MELLRLQCGLKHIPIQGRCQCVEVCIWLGQRCACVCICGADISLSQAYKAPVEQQESRTNSLYLCGLLPKKSWAILSRMSMKIHDSGYKKLFSNRTIFRQLMERFVAQPWVAALDFSACKRTND